MAVVIKDCFTRLDELSVPEDRDFLGLSLIFFISSRKKTLPFFSMIAKDWAGKDFSNVSKLIVVFKRNSVLFSRSDSTVITVFGGHEMLLTSIIMVCSVSDFLISLLLFNQGKLVRNVFIKFLVPLRVRLSGSLFLSKTGSAAGRLLHRAILQRFSQALAVWTLIAVMAWLLL